MKILIDKNDLYINDKGTEIYGSLSGKFKIGDHVKISDRGRIYSTYFEMIKAMKLNNYKGFSYLSRNKKNNIFIVVNRKIHENLDDIVYGIERNNKIFLIGEKGLEKIKYFFNLLDDSLFKI